MRPIHELIAQVAPIADPRRGGTSAVAVAELLEWFVANKGVLSTGQNTITRIHDAKNKCVCATGESPERVYLGHKDWRSLQEYVKALGFVSDPRYTGRRAEVLGLEVYLVDADEHIAVL